MKITTLPHPPYSPDLAISKVKGTNERTLLREFGGHSTCRNNGVEEFNFWILPGVLPEMGRTLDQVC